MVQANVPFDKRLKQIVRRHNRMANGVVQSINSDGLIVTRPRVYKPRFPLKGMLILIAAGVLFKAFLLAYLGPATYSDRVALLQNGSAMEKAGAWVMQADPLTVIVADNIRPVLP